VKTPKSHNSNRKHSLIGNFCRESYYGDDMSLIIQTYLWTIAHPWTIDTSVCKNHRHEDICIVSARSDFFRQAWFKRKPLSSPSFWCRSPKTNGSFEIFVKATMQTTTILPTEKRLTTKKMFKV